jgi:hypothetical protein
MMAGADEVQYLVLPDFEDPYLLARVRWPDVFQAISPVRPDWQDDPGLFDLPYSPSSTAVTFEQATVIAAEWGAELPNGEETELPRRALMRRMPADWSNLSRAEKRAWSIEFAKPGKPAAARGELAEDPEVATSAPRRGWWRRRRQDVTPSLEQSEVPQVASISYLVEPASNGNGATNGNGRLPAAGADVIDLTDTVIDLTDAREDLAATAEDA